MIQCMCYSVCVNVRYTKNYFFFIKVLDFSFYFSEMKKELRLFFIRWGKLGQVEWEITHAG